MNIPNNAVKKSQRGHEDKRRTSIHLTKFRLSFVQSNDLVLGQRQVTSLSASGIQRMLAVVQTILHHLPPQGGSADSKQGGGTSHLVITCM
jgi:hypothetical protein